MRAKSPPAKELPKTARCYVVPDGRKFKVEHWTVWLGLTPIGTRLIRSTGVAPDLDVCGKTLEEATALMHEWTRFLDKQEALKEKLKKKSR